MRTAIGVHVNSGDCSPVAKPTRVRGETRLDAGERADRVKDLFVHVEG